MEPSYCSTSAVYLNITERQYQKTSATEYCTSTNSLHKTQHEHANRHTNKDAPTALRRQPGDAGRAPRGQRETHACGCMPASTCTLKNFLHYTDRSVKQTASVGRADKSRAGRYTDSTTREFLLHETSVAFLHSDPAYSLSPWTHLFLP